MPYAAEKVKWKAGFLTILSIFVHNVAGLRRERGVELPRGGGVEHVRIPRVRELRQGVVPAQKLRKTSGWKPDAALCPCGSP